MNYIDLGLPSGTLWADENADGYYNFDEAKEKFGESLPSKEQWQELIDHCEWLWDFKHNQMVVIGKNGNRIVLPAAGYLGDTILEDVGFDGYYWSSSIFMGARDKAYLIYFDSDNVCRDHYYHRYRQSVRQIKNK